MIPKKYDYLIVGAGLYGSVFARQMVEQNKKVLVIDKNPHLGGHIYTKETQGIHVHVYGPHYFHTNDKTIWNYVNKFTEFNQVRATVMADYKNKMYSLPFNMFTFLQLWGCRTPTEAKSKINEQIVKCDNPTTLEEWALSQVGRDIYEIFIKGYTTKQWGKPPHKLPPSIIKRIPIRFSFNTDYHRNAKYTGIPIEGYTKLIENLLDGIPVKLQTNFLDVKNWERFANYLVFTGPIDEFFHYKHGHLEYRTLSFKNNVVEGDFQGVAQVNYTDQSVPYTRTIEHKYFYENPDKKEKSVVTFEFPETWDDGKEPYYPVNDNNNSKIYQQYAEEAKLYPNILFAGRLGKYKYIDMDQVISMALKDSNDFAF